MGSSLQPPSPEFLRRFHALASPASAMSFEQFMALALFDAEVGYYRQYRERVGLNPRADFFTATSVGDLFGELIAACCVDLLGAAACAQSEFVEIGAEPGGGILRGLAHPFASSRVIQLGQPIALSGPCVVFSNELFDAQPCRRFVRRQTAWRELGVACAQGELREIELPLTDAPTYLPTNAPEGYVIDAPRAATDLMRDIASGPWHGLLLACDYGKTWAEITTTCPAGTMRAYRHHQQSNDLLAYPGEQDLTCHVCWDWLQAELQAADLASPPVASQEAFFIRHAARLLESTMRAEADRMSPRKMALMQLIHPAHMGQKFQVLHGIRRPKDI
ncbi:MAG: SAM-dependent methyltransferase [Opitutaceae bacterium]|nr:SAM-dependent methyltransferase [Opitutaceae bacterium]